MRFTFTVMTSTIFLHNWWPSLYPSDIGMANLGTAEMYLLRPNNKPQFAQMAQLGYSLYSHPAPAIQHMLPGAVLLDNYSAVLQMILLRYYLEGAHAPNAVPKLNPSFTNHALIAIDLQEKFIPCQSRIHQLCLPSTGTSTNGVRYLDEGL